MLQKIKTEVIIEVPAEFILVRKSEWEELKEQQLTGRYWNMKNLEERTGMKQQWLKSNLLYVPKFKQQLEEFSYYPNSQGEKWAFQATKMAQFLEDNFYRIFKGNHQL